MLHEIGSHEYSTFVQVLRVAKDDYAARKVQKDRTKVKKLLDGLLADREVIIFYNDNGVEKQVIGTTKKFVEKEEWPAPVLTPLTTEIINNKEVLEDQYCRFWAFPQREPIAVHVDKITKFIVRTEGLTSEFFNKIKHGLN